MSETAEDAAPMRLWAKVTVAVVCGAATAGLLWWLIRSLGWHGFGIAWLSAKITLKAAALGAAGLTALTVWLRKRRKA
ncbi:hypothetical protein [Streptomyces sp. URMC 123]|uniref:hypothetical protein n=1 Tax=Streptomyces sp. URMC 123 TaxID=3423403 RepID=UPI003F1A92F1